MVNFDERLPKDKFDFESIERLQKMEREELVPLLPGLLEWIQDMNWPIANDVAKILLAFPEEIVPHLKNVFATDDDIWKYWCLGVIVKKLPLHYKRQLKADLVRLSQMPNEGEKLEELDSIAQEILDSI